MTELAALPNPFRDNVVQDAWQSPADVAEIHEAAFKACLAGIDSASLGVADSLLIYGSAGSGKTHLLTRLQRHLAQTAKAAPDQVLRCVFVFVRLQTAPQLLWQHLRRRLATDLMRREQGLSQLQRLVAHQLGLRLGKSARAAVFRLRVQREEDQHALSRELADLTESLGLPRDLRLVVEHLVLHRSTLDAGAWLAGESLPERVLEQLGLGIDPPDDREQGARAAVTALCRLAGATLPIVFCFDQVEALQRFSDDREAFFRFGQLAADLHDTGPNVFLVTCLQSSVLELFRGAIRQADRDRMAKRHAALEPLDRVQVQSLIASRLALLPELSALAGDKQQPYFPLSTSFVHGLAADPATCVPRRVLSAAARRFEEHQHGQAAPSWSDAEFLASELFLRQQTAKTELAPGDTTRVVLHGIQVLAKFDGAKLNDRDCAPADLLIDGKRKVALSLRNEADARSLGPKLKALVQHLPRKDGARLVVVRDPRLTIPKTAIRAREHLAALQQRGAVLLEPSLTALAALQALESIFADAKSGDLANDGELVREGGVLEWLRGLRGDVAAEPVFEFLNAIVGENEAPEPQRPEQQDLAELLARERVLELDVASQQLGHSAALLLQLARQNTERFLVLDGPPVVLLDVAGTSAELGE
ncbi:MAG: hypothetical protein ABI895_26640 [Deltaproteobacteria bacterium]